jgi:DNA-binding Lrp family transcriptional regulator
VIGTARLGCTQQAILNLLREPMSEEDLADRVGLGFYAVRAKLRRLEKLGLAGRLPQAGRAVVWRLQPDHAGGAPEPPLPVPAVPVRPLRPLPPPMVPVAPREVPGVPVELPALPLAELLALQRSVLDALRGNRALTAPAVAKATGANRFHALAALETLWIAGAVGKIESGDEVLYVFRGDTPARQSVRRDTGSHRDDQMVRRILSLLAAPMPMDGLMRLLSREMPVTAQRLAGALDELAGEGRITIHPVTAGSFRVNLYAIAGASQPAIRRAIGLLLAAGDAAADPPDLPTAGVSATLGAITPPTTVKLAARALGVSAATAGMRLQQLVQAGHARMLEMSPRRVLYGHASAARKEFEARALVVFAPHGKADADAAVPPRLDARTAGMLAAITPPTTIKLAAEALGVTQQAVRLRLQALVRSGMAKGVAFTPRRVLYGRASASQAEFGAQARILFPELTAPLEDQLLGVLALPATAGEAAEAVGEPEQEITRLLRDMVMAGKLASRGSYFARTGTSESMLEAFSSDIPIGTPDSRDWQADRAEAAAPVRAKAARRVGTDLRSAVLDLLADPRGATEILDGLTAAGFRITARETVYATMLRLVREGDVAACLRLPGNSLVYVRAEAGAPEGCMPLPPEAGRFHAAAGQVLSELLLGLLGTPKTLGQLQREARISATLAARLLRGMTDSGKVVSGRHRLGNVYAAAGSPGASQVEPWPSGRAPRGRPPGSGRKPAPAAASGPRHGDASRILAEISLDARSAAEVARRIGLAYARVWRILRSHEAAGQVVRMPGPGGVLRWRRWPGTVRPIAAG